MNESRSWTKVGQSLNERGLPVTHFQDEQGSFCPVPSDIVWVLVHGKPLNAELLETEDSSGVRVVRHGILIVEFPKSLLLHLAQEAQRREILGNTESHPTSRPERANVGKSRDKPGIRQV